MPKKSPEIQVLIPYSQLLELLEASRKAAKIEKDLKRLQGQFSALQYQFCELMEAFREIKD